MKSAVWGIWMTESDWTGWFGLVWDDRFRPALFTKEEAERLAADFPCSEARFVPEVERETPWPKDG